MFLPWKWWALSQLQNLIRKNRIQLKHACQFILIPWRAGINFFPFTLIIICQLNVCKSVSKHSWWSQSSNRLVLTRFFISIIFTCVGYSLKRIKSSAWCLKHSSRILNLFVSVFPMVSYFLLYAFKLKIYFWFTRQYATLGY